MPGQKSTTETRLMGSVNLGMEGTGKERGRQAEEPKQEETRERYH